MLGSAFCTVVVLGVLAAIISSAVSLDLPLLWVSSFLGRLLLACVFGGNEYRINNALIVHEL